MLSDAIGRAQDHAVLGAAAVLILGAVVALWWVRVTTRIGVSRAEVRAAVDKAERASAAPPLPTRQSVVAPGPVPDPRPALPIGVIPNTAVWVAKPRQGAVAHRVWAGQTPEGTPVIIRDEHGHLLATYGMVIPAEMGAQHLRLQWCLRCFPPVIPGAGHRLPGRRSAS